MSAWLTPTPDWLAAHAETFHEEPIGCTHHANDPWCACPTRDEEEA